MLSTAARLRDARRPQLAATDTEAIQAATNQPSMSHDLLEHALVACLAAFAELAGASGQPDRAFRLRDAADVIRCRRAPSPLTVAGELRPVSDLAAGVHVPTPAAPTAPNRTRCPLSSRELEVAALVTRGLTNRQIATELVISERTADTHLQNILSKLGAVSRTQIAIWFMEYALGLSSQA